jgi:ABC-type uncharacterized transport system ATPase subunit
VKPTLLQMKGIGKRFPLVTALSDVSFSVAQGEVHALLGENGAGKSTLMNLLSGLLQPDEGQILLQEHPVTIGSPQQAAALGIGMVHQHLSLVGTLTAAENVLLPRVPFWISERRLQEEFAQLRSRFGMTVDGGALVAELPLPERQQVELLRVLAAAPKLLILDEPTAVLTVEEAARLALCLREHVGGGGAVIYISHKLDEVLAVADRVTVLRRGRVVAAGIPTQSLDRAELAQRMMGEQAALSSQLPEERPERIGITIERAEILVVENLHVESDRHHRVLRGVSLRLRAGELFGIAGMGGSGQHELCEALLGIRPVHSGQIHLDGVNVTNFPTGKRRQLGLGMVPEDRLLEGVAPHLSVAENCCLNPPLRPQSWLSQSAFVRKARKLIEPVELPENVLSAPVWTLSGGNMQKVILARELATPNLQVLVAAYPCRGLDIGAIAAVHRLLRACCQRGIAVLLLSEDLDELLTLSDRIAVLVAGQLHGECAATDADRTALGLLLGGVIP